MERQPKLIITVPLIQWLLLVLLFAAILNAQRTLIYFTFLIFSMLTGARLWAVEARRNLVVKTFIDGRRVFPGDVVKRHIVVSNEKLLPLWISVKAEETAGLAAVSEESKKAWKGTLLGRQERSFDESLMARNRGIYNTGAVNLAAGDLLGLYLRDKRVEDATDEIIVYPKISPIDVDTGIKRDLFGRPQMRNVLCDPLYPVGTRDYQYSNPARHINWKASVRHNRLQEKVFEPSAEASVLIALDVTDQDVVRSERSFETAVELAASVAVNLSNLCIPMGLVTNGFLKGRAGAGLVPVSAGSSHLPGLLEILARLEPRSMGDISALVSTGLKLPWGLSCIYVGSDDGSASGAFRSFCDRRRLPFRALNIFQGSCMEEGSGARQMKAAVRGAEP